MKPCHKCDRNDWKYIYAEGMVTATCSCGHAVTFKAKEKEAQTLEENAPCRKCGEPIALRQSNFNQKKLKKSYYFTAYWWCKACRTMYYDEQFKVLNESVMDKNIKASLALGEDSAQKNVLKRLLALREKIYDASRMGNVGDKDELTPLDYCIIELESIAYIVAGASEKRFKGDDDAITDLWCSLDWGATVDDWATGLMETAKKYQ